jgi:hypothetical protein
MKIMLAADAACTLTGCVTKTASVATQPLTGAEAQAFDLFVDLAVDQAMAEVIAEDCPRLRYDKRIERRQVEGLLTQTEALLNGDLQRAQTLFERLDNLSKRQRRAIVEPRVLAYIKANDYLPGSIESACRVGDAERANNTAIGRLLAPE